MDMILKQNDERTKDRNDEGGFDKAAVDFCEMMQLGAKWLVQHVAMMQDKFPDHPVFWHPLFQAGLLNYRFYCESTHNTRMSDI